MAPGIIIDEARDDTEYQSSGITVELPEAAQWPDNHEGNGQIFTTSQSSVSNGDSHWHSNGINHGLDHAHDGNNAHILATSGSGALGNDEAKLNEKRHTNESVTSMDGHTGFLPEIPIAICGAGIRLPGGIRTTSELYDFLIQKKDARTTIPQDRYNSQAFYDPNHTPGTIRTEHGYFLDVSLSQFDPSMFGASNLEIATMDPAQRLLLEVTREAFETSGEANYRGKRIGVFVGDFTADFDDLQSKDTVMSAPYSITGSADFVLANRLTAEYDLTGPSVTIKTACSATAEAIHQACLSLRAGCCEGAIVGGANLILTPRTSIAMSQAGVLAPDGSCKTFDAGANGFARGESVSVMYLKPLDAAVRDGNPVRAVIRATGSNGDGGGSDRNFGTPNARTQEALIRHTYAAAGLPLQDTKVVEAHGTGTVVGDPLEAESIVTCFSGNETLYMGSVKPNVGHGEGGSAMASVFKAMLALENKTIIPNIKFETPNPKIPWERNVKVPTEPIPWPANVKQRMSINSFGLGGSNAHIIIDSAESVGVSTPCPNVPVDDVDPRKKSILLLSGNSAPAVSELAVLYRQYLERNPSRIDSMVYTAAYRRERLQLLSYAIVDGAHVSDAVTPVAASETDSIIFVFTGQGAQWVGMGREMMQQNAKYSASIRHMDDVLRSIDFAPEWTLEEILSANGDDDTLLNASDRSQPVCAALQVAYVDALAEYGIRPDAVVGHSSGEIASAYAAGILTREEAIITAYYRGYANNYNKLPGGMAAIGLAREQVEPLLKSGVVVGCENSDRNVTISGNLGALQETMERIRNKYPEALVRQLRVPMAYHSHQMRAASDVYGKLIEPHLTPRAPKIPFYSTVYGRKVSEAKVFNHRYWQNNMEQPVLFRSAIKALLQDQGEERVSVHLEIGPHSALAGPLRQVQHESGREAKYVTVAKRSEDSARRFLEAIGELHCLGLRPAMPCSDDVVMLPDLPTYPWNYTTNFWTETRPMSNYRSMKHRRHELLGIRVPESSEIEPMWRNLINCRDVGWLEDHRVGPDTVFPAAGYIAMAGAAVGQIMGSTEYTVQEVTIANALLLNDKKPTEILTTLRKQSLTVFNDSKAWEFTIASENNGVWTKHCFGLVTGGCAIRLPAANFPVYSRKIDSSRWYTAMSRIGLKYGPRFVGLTDISASPVHPATTLSIVDNQEGRKDYPLHPSTLDMVLQSFTIAGTHGVYRNLQKLFLPVFIEKMFVGSHAEQTLRVHSKADNMPGTATGSAYAAVDDQVALVIQGFKGFMMDDSYKQQVPQLRSLTPQWHPSIDFVKIDSLIKRRRDIADGCADCHRAYNVIIAELEPLLDDLDYAQPYFRNYVDKIRRDLQLLRDGKGLGPGAGEILSMSSDSRRQEIESYRSRVTSDMSLMLELLLTGYNNFKDLMEGRTQYLDLVLKDDLLARFYDQTNDNIEFADFVRLVGLNNPQIRILELGAGTGGTTACALKGLHTDGGERLYAEYIVTDVSAGFTAQCKDRFREYGGMKYSVLDVTKDPIEQGFEAGSYDMIVAANVLHISPDLNASLENCRKLLKPEGYLFLQECNPAAASIGMIFGFFEGWWGGVNDGRPYQPTLTPTEWNKRLDEAGFAPMEAVVQDGNHPLYWNVANMVARPMRPRLEEEVHAITLLKRSEHLSAFGNELKAALEASGYAVDECTFGQEAIPLGQDVISLVDADINIDPILANIDRNNLAALQELIKDAVGSVLLWLMPIAQAGCTNPHFGQVLGMARNIRAELGLDIGTMELDELSGTKAALAVEQVFSKIQSARQTTTEADDVDIELEWMWRDDQISINRVHSSPVLKELTESSPDYEAKHLTIGHRGMLQSLHWTGHNIRPLGPNDVRVRVTAVGMNFLDLAIAMGIVDTAKILGEGYNTLGSEGTGRVVEVGGNVKDFAVGDRVVTMCTSAAVFSTELTLPATACGTVADCLSDEDAAGLLIPYVTVIWSVVHKANMQPGQTLLIHSAAGGVGIAAINVARWLGLKFFCTVGSPAKVDFLVETMGVPREHIFHSRNDSFLYDVLEATGGIGVDAALNSLSGELLHATWKCIAAGGSMLEIGKRDFLGRAHLAMNPFEDNRAYFGIDLARLAVTNTMMLGKLCRQTMDLIREGIFKPLHPTTVYDADKVEDAFRYMQKGVHMGRIVVRMPNDVASITAVPEAPTQTFRQDRSYLLVGGNGGLGKSVVSWMVENGARCVLVVSRSAGTKPEDQLFREEMHELGCDLQYYAGDTTDLAFVQGVVGNAKQPIAGAMQLAMVLNDANFLDLDIEAWTHTVDPKVRGTLNLHEALPHDMDFFILASSVSGALASIGQANYAAANTFLDAFAHFRRGLGLPATVLDIAAMGDVGYVTQVKGFADRLGRFFGRLLTEQELHRCLQLAIVRSEQKALQQSNTVSWASVEQVMMHNDGKHRLADERSSLPWRREARMTIYRNLDNDLEQSLGEDNDGLRSFLASLVNNPEQLDQEDVTQFVAMEIAKMVYTLLMRDASNIDLSAKLSSIGTDSLVAIELRNWWKRSIGIEITILELADPSNTLQTLGDLAVKRLREKYAAK